MKRGKRKLLKAYVLPDELGQVQEMAKRLHLTASELVRRLVLGRSLPDSARHDAVQELSRINADLARLGNLLRMTLADPDFRPPGDMSLKTMFATMRNLQNDLKLKIKEL